MNKGFKNGDKKSSKMIVASMKPINKNINDSLNRKVKLGGGKRHERMCWGKAIKDTGSKVHSTKIFGKNCICKRRD